MQSVPNKALGEGITALSLVVLILAVGIFPIPIIIYLAYLKLFTFVAVGIESWLQELITSWSRLIGIGIVGVALVLGAIGLGLQENLSGSRSLFAELDPKTFRVWALLIAGLYLLVRIFVSSLKRLWQRG